MFLRGEPPIIGDIMPVTGSQSIKAKGRFMRRSLDAPPHHTDSRPVTSGPYGAQRNSGLGMEFVARISLRSVRAPRV